MSERPSWRFEAIGPGHADALARLFARNDVPAVTATFDPFPLDAETARRIATQPREDRYYAAVAPDGTILGMTMLRGWDEGYDVPSFGTFVDHELHGRGVGSGLLDETIAAARALGAPRIRLSVYASNEAAHGIYRSRGFQEVERGAARVAGRDDERVIMLLELQAPPA